VALPRVGNAVTEAKRVNAAGPGKGVKMLLPIWVVEILLPIRAEGWGSRASFSVLKVLNSFFEPLYNLKRVAGGVELPHNVADENGWQKP
jgi:hypothetical protein